MRVTLCLLLSVVCVLADKNGSNNRRTKPFIADAVGNTLPPPSNVPATVGSPISLLTPDRYEFYTFDESGELVKRLMTLEEIQAIVAAGEDSEGLVTFANDNQPTIAFNFSQPPYTKVHSVVTNVQNVLKAQMEAHKNKPPVQPTLDTPDVSDSWSLILPSIFGNSGVDIIPENVAGSYTPETETFEETVNVDNEENSLSKEGGSQISSSTTEDESENVINKKTTPAESTKTSLGSSTSTTTTTTTTTTTANPTTTKKITTTPKPTSTTTIRNKLISTTRLRTTTTKPPPTTKLHPTTKPTTTTTTIKLTTTTLTPRTTSTKPTTTTTKKQTTTTSRPSTNKEYISNDIPTAKPTTGFEKISTFIPISTIKYVTERTTQNPVEFTEAPFVYAPTTKRSPSTTTKSPQPLSSTEVPKLQTTAKIPTFSTDKIDVTSAVKDSDLERINLTTITTQSVSPSTTVSSTEFLLLENSQSNFSDDGTKNDDPIIPLFDVAQSISQIASDLGNNYQPIPTSSSLLDTTKVNVIDNMESKEDLDMDIPNDDQSKNKNEDNFVKISTIDPHPKQNIKEKEKEIDKKEKTTTETVTTAENLELNTVVSVSSEGTTIDPFLTESMGDLLSQIVHEAPQPILNSEKTEINNIKVITADKNIETTTNIVSEGISEISTTRNILSTTQKTIIEPEKQVSPEKETPVEVATEKEIPVKNSTKIETPINVTTEKVTPEKYTSEKEKPVIFSNKNETTVKETIENEPLVRATEKETLVKTTTEQSSVTTHKIIVPDKELTKFNLHTNNKVSTGDKKNEKDDDSKDFVKISVSNPSPITNSSNIELNKQIGENVKFNENYSNKTNISHKQDNDDHTKEIITEQKNKESTLEVVTTSPEVEITIKPTKFSDTKNKTVNQSNVNKISTADKFSSINNMDKIPDSLPKVDEFKKKIQKVNDEELTNIRNDQWKLISTVTPPKGNDILKDKIKPETSLNPSSEENKNVVLEFSQENQGLLVTTKDLGDDIAQFTELCNELAFRYWNKMLEKTDRKRSFVLSPYSITSMLAMMFMGAKGATSGEMNEILKLDDMVTFNPHFTLKNISDSIDQATNSGIAVSAFVRELFSDRNKGKILTFYKERAQHFYSGHVEEVNFNLISDIIRRRTNLLVKKHTWGRINEYMKTNSIVMKPPLAAFSTNIYQTDCTGTSVEGRDGEMYFVVSPNVRQRRLVPVPAVVYKSGFLAGYDPVLDATAAALGNTNSIVSTIFLMPGQQGNIVHGDDLEKLEQRLLEADPTTPVWNRVLRTLLPRVGLELQIPRFSHKSVFNVSSTLREMGLKDLFDADHADLGGLNGPSKDLYLSDMIQMTSFVTCGEGMIGEQHHVEEYPEILSAARRRTSRWADWDEPRDYQRAFHDPHDVGEAMHLPLHLRPRQARLPTRSAQSARLKFDRPFLFFVRHNPSGMILYVGRYNPRLLP